nr:alpha/beta hydrolase [Massilia sp. JS1662]
MRAFVEHSQSFQTGSDELEARRAAFLRMCRHYTPYPVPGSVRITDADVDGIGIRTYRPAIDPPAGGWPTMLYLHGGGWNMGSLDTHDWFAFALLRRMPIAVVAVDYRLAPEAPYPAALHDALQVHDAVRAGEVAADLNRERLVVCGDSAGGTLAAALCIALRDTGGRQPDAQALLCPVLSARTGFPSMHTCSDAPLLTAAGLAASIAGYLPVAADRANPRAMPLEATYVDGLPRTFVAVAEFDPLRDQGRAYAGVLRKAGVGVTEYVGAGLVHGSLRAPHIAEVDALYGALCDFLRDV